MHPRIRARHGAWTEAGFSSDDLVHSVLTGTDILRIVQPVVTITIVGCLFKDEVVLGGDTVPIIADKNCENAMGRHHLPRPQPCPIAPPPTLGG